MGGATPLISESLLDESDDGCVDFNLFSLSGGLRMDASRDRSGDAATSADRSGDKSLRGVRRLKDAGGTGQVRLFLSDSIENRMY